MRYPSTRLLTLSIVLFVLIAGIGCSGNGGGLSPTAPPLDFQSPRVANVGPIGHHILWGLYNVSINPDTAECDIVPLRGLMFNANVTRFLQPPSSPIHMLTIQIHADSDFITGYVNCDVTLQHPFVGLDKFRGFDVRGIVMDDGDVPFGIDPSAVRSGYQELLLGNADGYTRWWNPTEFTTYDTILGYTHGAKAPPTFHASATINPYKYFADGLASEAPISDLDLSNRGTFSVSQGVNSRNYKLYFNFPQGAPDFRFNYAIDASWALPSEDYWPDYPVDAFPPEANTQEAWMATLDDEGTTAWYVNETANGGYLNLNVEVFDWQGSLHESGVLNEVSAIWIESPLFDNPVDILPSAILSPGTEASSVFTTEITDFNLTEAGTFSSWVIVESAYPANYAPAIDGDPYMFDWPDVPVRAFFRGIIEISGIFPSDAPIIDVVVPNQGEQSTVVADLQIIGGNFQNGAVVDFSFDGSTDLEVTNVQWQDENLITCDVNCEGPLGFYDVTVMNPDTQQGTGEDIFEVIEAEGDSIWWQSHQYNCQNYGRNPTVPGADPSLLQEDWSSPVSGDKKYCTPVVAEGKIFFTGNDGFYGNTSMTIYAFDLYTGVELWSWPINNDNITSYRAFACPVWWQDSGGNEYVAVGGDQIYCYEANSGTELWTFDAMISTYSANWISNQMQEFDGMLLARSRHARLFVIDFITGAEITYVDCSSSSEGGCGAKDGLVYISAGHFVDCANIMTGEIQWSTELPYDAGISHWINPSIVDDRMYTSTYQGYVFAIAIEGNMSYTPGEIIWEWKDPDIGAGSNPLVGGTAVSDNKVFVAAAFSGNYVYCIEDLGDSGVTLWESSTTGYFDASPVWSSANGYPDGVVYCPDRDGYIRAYDVTDGSEVWAYDTGGEFRAGVSPILDMLVVTSGTDVGVFSEP